MLFAEKYSERGKKKGISAMSVCLNHPDTPAVTRCVTCGKPLCENCIVAGKYCSDSCRNAGISGAQRAGEVVKERRKTNAKGASRAVAITLIIALIAACAYWYYQKNSRKFNAKGSKLVQKFDSAAQQVIRKGHEAIPKSSTYKRNRENLVK